MLITQTITYSKQNELDNLSKTVIATTDFAVTFFWDTDTIQLATL